MTVEYDCGWCDWTYETDDFIDGLIETVEHYNYQHSIQGWVYRNTYERLRSDNNE